MSYDMEPPEGPPAGPGIEMTLTVKSFDTSGLYTDVVNRLADRFGGEAWSHSKLRNDVVADVNAIVTDRLRDVLAEGIEALLTKPITARDAFGNPVGQATTLADIVASAGQRFLTERVDREGKPATSSYDRGKPRIEWMVEQIAVKELEKLVADEAKAIRAALAAKAKAAAAAILAGVRV